jgi:hypothetical protein
VLRASRAWGNQLSKAGSQSCLSRSPQARAVCGSRYRNSVALCVFFLFNSLLLLATVVPAKDELTVEELKAKVSSTNVADRPHICVQIAQKELNESDRLYASADVDKAQAALTDVVAYSELARDYSLQSHHYEKQAEIAVREMTRKLNQLLHTLSHDEQPPVKNAVTRLEHVRDDLLASMFKKGAK